MPLMPPIAKTALEITPSRESNQGSPTPAGIPLTAVWIIPPRESPQLLASAIRSSIAPATSDSTGKGLPSSEHICASQSGPKASSVTPPQLRIWVPTKMERRSRAFRQTAPAATIPAVTLPEKCPPPLLSWKPWYLAWAA